MFCFKITDYNIYDLTSTYPVDCLKQLDVHGITGELALDLDQRVTGGHGLDQEAVCGQGLRIRNTLGELAFSGLAHSRQVQVSFC